ncbi:hypothetical protein JX266_008637 [Neoarthrinium moseri]|nr:hypothetical protein JX266_008637 [Neoarthrinium moseri]
MFTKINNLWRRLVRRRDDATQQERDAHAVLVDNGKSLAHDGSAPLLECGCSPVACAQGKKYSSESNATNNFYAQWAATAPPRQADKFYPREQRSSAHSTAAASTCTLERAGAIRKAKTWMASCEEMQRSGTARGPEEPTADEWFNRLDAAEGDEDLSRILKVQGRQEAVQLPSPAQSPRYAEAEW